VRWASDTAPCRPTAAKLWNPDDLLALTLDTSADIVAIGRRTGQMTVTAGRSDSSPTSWPRLRRGAWNTTQRDRDRGAEGHSWDTPSPVHES
jgi:hypothetical protein